MIRAAKSARNTLVDLEELSDDELAQLKKEFERLRNGDSGSRKAANKARSSVKKKKPRAAGHHRRGN